jgi:hypothetical protein
MHKIAPSTRVEGPRSSLATRYLWFILTLVLPVVVVVTVAAYISA